MATSFARKQCKTHGRQHTPRSTDRRGQVPCFQADLTDSNGNKPDPELIEQAVDDAAGGFADAPVQDFVPLLVEHDARDELREEGMRLVLDEADTEAPISGR